MDPVDPALDADLDRIALAKELNVAASEVDAQPRDLVHAARVGMRARHLIQEHHAAPRTRGRG